jgi:predicted O-methyltransferase YrrM
MNISQSRFFRLFGSGLPTTCALQDLEAMEYGSIDDRRALLALARSVHPATVIEIGVQSGGTAKLLLDELPCIRKYIGIDLPPGQTTAIPDQASEIPLAPGGLVADHPAFKLRLARSENIKPGSLPKADLIFVDGGHDKDTVLADSLLAADRIKPGGIIVWHDYHNHTVHVTEAIDQINQANGDHICLVEGTWIVFQLAATIEEGE